MYEKPSVLPASSSHSTLSPELLNILRQAQSASVTRSLRPTPDVDGSVPAETVTTTTSGPAARESNQLTPDCDLPPSDCCADLPVSNSDPPPSDSDRTLKFYQHTAAGPSETPVPLQLFPKMSTPVPQSKPAAVPGLPPGPFPGSTLLPIQPLNLTPECKDELLRLLSNLSTTTASGSRRAELIQPCPLPATSPNPDLRVPLVPETTLPQQLPSAALPTPAEPAFTADPPAPPPSPQPVAQQLLKLLLSSPSTISQLNSVLGCSVPGITKTEPPSSNSCSEQPADNKSGLNLEFMKYLTTLPSYRSSQSTDTAKY